MYPGSCRQIPVAFYEMKPGFNTDGFREYRTGLNNIKFDNLIQCVEQLNAAIAGDESLGEGFCIGHSYFCNLKEVSDQALAGIVEYELIEYEQNGNEKAEYGSDILNRLSRDLTARYGKGFGRANVFYIRKL